MPELPEVEVVRAGLAPAVEGAVVTAVEVLDERSLRRHPGPAEDFVERLLGARLAAPSRRGKFLWVPLASPPHPVPVAAVKNSGDMTRGVARCPSAMVKNSGESGSERAFSTTWAGIQGDNDGPAARSPQFFVGTAATQVAAAVETPQFSTGAKGRAESAIGRHALVVHLGMSGQLRLRTADAPRDRLSRVVLDLEHPTCGPLRIDFVDQRIFGSMALDRLVAPGDAPEERIPSQVAHIARDPLDPRFDDAAFLAALLRRNTGVKRALLDQTLVSGIGNIYADEALWASRIHYDQPTRGLSRPRARMLLAEVRLVLGRAIAEGGTSFDTLYVNVNGASGYFSRSLSVYGQAGRPCPRCGRPISRESFMNRGSHFCRSCQRIRRVT